MTLVNLRDFLGVAKKLQKSIFKNNNGIKSTINRMDRSVPNYRIGIRMKNGGGPRSFEW